MLQQFFGCSLGDVSAHRDTVLPAVVHRLEDEEEEVVVASLSALSVICGRLAEEQLRQICDRILQLTSSTSSTSVRLVNQIYQAGFHTLTYWKKYSLVKNLAI